MADPVFQALGLVEDFEPSLPKGPGQFPSWPPATMPPCPPGMTSAASHQLLQQLQAQSSAAAWGHAAAAVGSPNFQGLNPAMAGAAAAAAWAAVAAGSMAAAPWVHAEGLSRLGLSQQPGPESAFWPMPPTVAPSKIAAQATAPSSSSMSSDAAASLDSPAFLLPQPSATGDSMASSSSGAPETRYAPGQLVKGTAGSPKHDLGAARTDEMLPDSCPELDSAIAALLQGSDDSGDNDIQVVGRRSRCDNGSSRIAPEVPTTPPSRGRCDMILGSPAKVSFRDSDNLQPPPGLQPPQCSKTPASPVVLQLSSMAFPQPNGKETAGFALIPPLPVDGIATDCPHDGQHRGPIDVWSEAWPYGSLPPGSSMDPHLQDTADAEGSAAGTFLLSLLRGAEEVTSEAQAEPGLDLNDEPAAKLAPPAGGTTSDVGTASVPKRSTRRGRRAGRSAKAPAT